MIGKLRAGWAHDARRSSKQRSRSRVVYPTDPTLALLARDDRYHKCSGCGRDLCSCGKQRRTTP